MNPYHEFVRKTAENLKEARELPLGEIGAPKRKPAEPDAPVGLIFSPHPDDECINGGLALRLMREAGFRIVNVPVTLGSDRARRPKRRTELLGACGYLGFEVEFLGNGGFGDIEPINRGSDVWRSAVEGIAGAIEKFDPRVLFYPHRHDRHPAHCGTNLLVTDALQTMPDDFACLTVENEFWQAMESPNLLVELDEQVVSDLIAALSFHVGEVRRNPYHLSLPAWMIDNVRRGSEIVGAVGGNAPDFVFGLLHRVSVFRNRRSHPAFKRGRFLSSGDDLSGFLEF